MDKHTQNVNNPGFSADSPKPSTTDSMIEQFKIDITKKSYDDYKNTRRLTIESDRPTPESDIDKQISELENLIKRLQEEIEEMSLNADRQAQQEYTIETKKSSNKLIGPIGHVYPIILRDVGMNRHEQYQTMDEDIMSPNMDHLTDISKNFRTLWNDTSDDLKEEDDVDSNIDKLIEELQSELIAEEMNKPKEAEEASKKSTGEKKPEEDTITLKDGVFDPNMTEHPT